MPPDSLWQITGLDLSVAGLEIDTPAAFLRRRAQPSLDKGREPHAVFFQPQIPQRYLEMNVSLLIPTVSFVR